MTKMEDNENFCVFEMETMDIMLYRYDINIWGPQIAMKFFVFLKYNTIL